MTIGLDSIKNVPGALVKSNLEILGTFEKGEKPKTDGISLLKEDRYMAKIRRGIQGGFDPNVIESTYYSAKEICERAKNADRYERREEILKDEVGIKKFVVESFRGLKNIEETYRKEAAITYLNPERKLLVADTLKRIYDTYHGEFTSCNRSVAALISVFDDGNPTKKSNREHVQTNNNGRSQASNARVFWKNQEQNNGQQVSTLRRSNEPTSNEDLPIVTFFGKNNERVSRRIQRNCSPAVSSSDTKENISVPKRRVTMLLTQMAQETVDKVRQEKEKKKNQGYKEKSSIKFFKRKKEKEEEPKAVIEKKESRSFEYKEKSSIRFFKEKKEKEVKSTLEKEESLPFLKEINL
ncbi:MAG: hypothetical protein AAGG81_03455, partial [Chlamydiota bacterium]